EDEGHEVANHTWTHKVLTNQKPDAIRAELEKTQLAIEKITGKKPTLMRPPQGRTDDTVSDISKDLGLSQVLWSATAKDYSTNDS
ncbi:polysaccharide deacetylase family protein, partial [Streptomyces sp. SID7499]|nr:polysaccharide deacetylase family protein [Streptomyces sp. SID7499]